MNKSLLLITLLLVSTVQAQRTVEEGFKNANPYLEKDPCNYNGILWIKGVLKIDPNNTEAKKIIKKCDDSKFNTALAALKSNIKDYNAKNTLSDAVSTDEEYNTEEANYLLAKANLENGVSHIVKKYISKAIDLNPNNMDYRWIRVRCNMVFNASTDFFKEATSDLNYMIANGVTSAKIYSALAIAEYELASSIYRFTRVETNDSFTDSKTSENNQRKAILEETILHYNYSKKSYQKALEIDKEAFKGGPFEINKIENEILTLQGELKKLT